MSGRQLKVGNYQIGERLGEGTFGTVVKATHAIAGERVAVKVLEKKRMQQADDIERVGREIQILKLLKHPYVVRLWEIIYEKDKIYPRAQLLSVVEVALAWWLLEEEAAPRLRHDGYIRARPTRPGVILHRPAVGAHACWSRVCARGRLSNAVVERAPRSRACTSESSTGPL
jgi:hypothetical protein